MHEKFHKAEKLMMRIRSLKWNATTIASSSTDDSARRAAAIIVTELLALEAETRAETTDDAFTDAERRVDGLSLRLAKLGPR